MTRRALRICSHPGCSSTVEPPAGRCAPHARQRQQDQDARRGSASARGYGRFWQKVRARVLAAEPLCRSCQDDGVVTAATEVDHIDGNSRNNARANLRPLCKPCHSRRTLRDQVPRRPR